MGGRTRRWPSEASDGGTQRFGSVQCGLTGTALQRAMSGARARYAELGVRLTDSRRQVLELLLESGRPVKAQHLMALLGQDGVPASPPIVYRALRSLEACGLVHQIGALNAYLARTDSHAQPAPAFLVCESCATVVEVAAPADAPLREAAWEREFRVRRWSLEAVGQCRDCAVEAAARPGLTSRRTAR